MRLAELIMKERELLKVELQALKSCQVQYFSFSITATGVLFGLAEKITDTSRPGSNAGIVYLIPLLVVIPLWSVFFDKASSITRIVGYLRILETMLVKDKTHRYIGWESALKAYRAKEPSVPVGYWGDLGGMCLNAGRAIGLLVNFREYHRYWKITWLTFFGLCVCSLYMSWVRGVTPVIFWTMSVIFILACLHNGDVLTCLINGNYSYNKREALWDQVLTNDKAKPITMAAVGPAVIAGEQLGNDILTSHPRPGGPTDINP